VDRVGPYPSWMSTMSFALWLLQADPWYVVLRDITVILAAASMVLASLFLGVVGWQLWRLGRELRDEAHPLVGSVQEIADTVRDTATFVKGRVTSLPQLGGGGGATEGSATASAGLGGTVRQLQRFYRGTRQDG